MTEHSQLTIAELERELERRRFEDPLQLVYHPYDKQIQLHRSRTPITLALGGNRSGKSWGAVAETQYYALGRATWAEVPTSPVVVWYVMPSLPMFRRSILPIFRRISPKKEIRRFYERDGIVLYKDLSELHFLSADMKQRRLQGASIDLAIMDETPDESVYDELLARLQDRHGRLILAFAPIDVSLAWVKEKVYLPWVSGERKDIEVVSFPTADRDGNPLVPWFTREDIKRMEDLYPDPDVRAARIYGEFISRAGLLYRSFNPAVHVIPRFDVPDTYARWLVIDPQYHRFACLYFAADDLGSYYVTDEYFSQDENLSARAERIASMVGKRDRAIPAYVDSANPQDVAELNWHFQRIGASVAAVPLPMQKKVDQFTLRVQSLLEPSDERYYPSVVLGDGSQKVVKLLGAPRLLFFSDLCSTWEREGKDLVTSRLFWELKRLSWGKNGKPDKDTADGGDCCDCLAYGCSIMQSGTSRAAPEAWQEGLSESDILMWRLIEESDNQIRLRED